ncbi:hypothetical protein BJX70DRAFT_366300 [Aspergillus crustosus]
MHLWISRPQRVNSESDSQESPLLTASEAAANLTTWYNAGRPLFPRSSLQSIRDELKKPLAQGDFIYIEGFDGEMYQHPVRIGVSKDYYPSFSASDDKEGSVQEDKIERWVLSTPCIYYTGYESLIRDLDDDLTRAYCPILIAHVMTRCGEVAEEVENVEGAIKSFDTTLRGWEGSETWREIKDTLIRLDLTYKIPKIIGMACGEFTITSRSEGSPRSSRRSAVQNAFLVTLSTLLQESGLGTTSVACYAQDPAYSPTDQAVLQSHGIEVVDDPDGFLRIDDTSLVFSCSPNICVKQIVTEIARPTILIWCSVDTTQPASRTTDPDSPRVREMIQKEYDVFPFPEDDRDDFTTMAIYVKKAARVPPNKELDSRQI